MSVVKLPHALEKRLSDLAKETHKSKNYYIEKDVSDLLDDQEDYLIALTRMERIEKN